MLKPIFTQSIYKKDNYTIKYIHNNKIHNIMLSLHDMQSTKNNKKFIEILSSHQQASKPVKTN